MTQHAKANEFDVQGAAASAATIAEQVADGAQDVAAKAAAGAEDLANTAADGAQDLVAWTKKAIEDNPGLAVAGAVAAGAVIAAIMMSRRQPTSEIDRMRRQAMDYTDRLERRARRELRKLDTSKTMDGVSEFVSTYGSQLGTMMASLASQAQSYIDQAKSKVR